MAIRVALRHVTEYRYDRCVTFQPHVVRLRPAPHCRTPITAYSLRVEPSTHFINWQQDPYSNYLARLAFPEPGNKLRVEVDLIAELSSLNPFDFFVEEHAEKYPFRYDAVLAKELSPYLEASAPGPLLGQLVPSLRKSSIRTIDYLVELNREVQRRVGYVIRMEPGIQSCEESLGKASGSCRDSAWLLVQVLRQLGFAARFASGYLIQLRSDLEPVAGPRGPDTDFTDLHAWTEVYLPGAGWIGLDPTSGLLAGEGHIPLACAADPTSAAAITGSFAWSRAAGEPVDSQCKEELSFEMSVARIHEPPRSTKPYTDSEWKAMDSFGERLDEELESADVRLTFGGEPTFVSAEHRDAPEWTIAALGAEKRSKAGVLLRRLRNRFAPGALLYFGQGKWYPGESLPRWSLSCFSRKDGEPVWRNPGLVADDTRDYGFGRDEAQRFMALLCSRLEVDPSLAIPGHEDVWHYLWRERQLPVNVDPLESRLEDPEERQRLSRIFDQGLGAVVGFALPLRRIPSGSGPRWESGRWLMRRERLYLTPGDSPMGFRLPLDSLPWEAPELRDEVVEVDPLAPRGHLSPHPARTYPGPELQRRTSTPGVNADPSLLPRSSSSLVRTALCVEPREGRLHVFFPPLAAIEDYLDLVARVEDTANELRMPILVEGYPPPFDHRIRQFSVTPDPGVIEVNVHPTQRWRELVENTSALYEEARQTGLEAEKYLVDGRQTGTGGGNHLVIGGPTPADSPILRRPDLLRSLTAYWHNHPSLSYLFSGLFIGPTSQAPRVDEARNDSLYELELAFGQIAGREHGKSSTPLWQVDRLFRHLLIDSTGNTHRAEFCIDKLYSPDGIGGRRGLLELRSVEMPPHERMSLAQQLLVRTLLAWFWKAPYERRLVRWGTELHDRYLLPHFLEQDFRDVIEDLRLSGYPIEEKWFAPHREFRFPLIGGVTIQGVRLELRPALEPWHVLGEEQGSGGTARYVDASVERLQVLAQGLTDERHFITCNGRRLPLHPTGTVGERVAGVRFRAWQPPSSLHPMIPVHGPLVFDLLDSWRERSMGGCTYHVSHPGGLAFETLPINASEAESRWKSRFWPFGHTPGTMRVPPAERLPEFPLTLDLRQPDPRRKETNAS